MSQVKCILSVVVVAAALCLFNGSAVAQSTTPSVTTCAASTNMQVNATQMLGDWYEMARNPAFNSSFNCVKLTVTEANETITIQTTYAGNANALSVNTTFSNSLNLADAQNSSGFQLSFTNAAAPTVPVTFKVLSTDYENYAFICGYTNSSDDTTSFGLVLARNRTLNSTQLNNYEMMASMNYSNFLSSNMPMIIQSSKCYTAGAATQVPIMAALFTMIYALLKFVH